MQIEILKSKIHRAIITESSLNYIGSLTLDESLMNAANIIENEKVQVVNINNGERLETYVIKGKSDSGIVCLNGPAARKGMPVILLLHYLMPVWILKKPKNSSPVLFFREKKQSSKVTVCRLAASFYFRCL